MCAYSVKTRFVLLVSYYYSLAISSNKVSVIINPFPLETVHMQVKCDFITSK